MTAAELLDLYLIVPDDLERNGRYGATIVPRLDTYAEIFYRWLAGQPEFEQLFQDKRRLERVKGLQKDHWVQFFQPEREQRYLDRLDRIGEAHARIGLSVHSYLSGLNRSRIIFLEELYDQSLPPEEYAAVQSSLSKLISLDGALVMHTYSRLTNEAMARQSQTLMEMSTPVTEIWGGILMLPAVGLIDSRRAQDMMNAILNRIAGTQSKSVILDISGVAVVDTAVANHLLKITRATRLMGCECIISGLSPAIAQTIVELGIEVGSIRTVATLKDALRLAFQDSGVQLRQMETADR